MTQLNDLKHDPTFTPYVVQPHKPWWCRKNQIEWEGCDFAARGYTRSGCIRRGTRWRRWDGAGRPLGLTWLDWKLERLWWST